MAPHLVNETGAKAFVLLRTPFIAQKRVRAQLLP